MPNFRISTVPRIFPAILLLAFSMSSPGLLYPQQSEIPPVALEEPSTDGATQPERTAAESERIVEGRPRLYSLKRFLHPVSWLESGMRPLLRVIGNTGVGNTSPTEKTEPDSGVKFGLDGLGAGSGFGPEVKPFHDNLFNKGIEVELPLVVTYKGYQSFSFRGNYPLVAEGAVQRIGLEFTTGYTSRAADKYFGTGNDAPRTAESRFRTVSREAAVAIDARINETWNARLETGYRSVGVTRPRNFRSAQDLFQGQDVPGLASGGRFISTSASIERNTKDHQRFPSRGSIHRFEASVNEGDERNDFSYWRFGYEIQQFFPLSSDDRKVIALRAHLETTEEKGGSRIPFFDLPTVGGSRTIRGLESRRFVDKSALNFSAEYRYRIWRHFDWGLFVDQGQVAPEIGDFGLNRFHMGYGMRFTVRPPGDRGVTIAVGRSNEAWRLYLDFNQNF